MKKIYRYHFNDGLDGVVDAKSLKHGAKKIAKVYGMSVYEIMDSVRKYWNDEKYEDFACDVSEIPKKKNIKSKIIGWCQN